MTDALSIECPKCKRPVGEPCKNYKGQNKQTCSVRAAAAFKAAHPIDQDDDQASGLAFPDDQADDQAEPVQTVPQLPVMFAEVLAGGSELFPEFVVRKVKVKPRRRDIPGQQLFAF